MMKLTIPDYISSLKPYKPGKPLEELEREYGISDSIKIASNENPLGPSPKALEAIRRALGNLHRYPDGSGFMLKRKISEKFGVDSGQVVLGNGSDEIIGMLTRAFLQPGDEVILPAPSFLMYAILVRSAGAVPVVVPLKALSLDLDGMKDRITAKTRMIFICNPNNPTGTFITGKDFRGFLGSIPEDLMVMVDEAYIEFVRKAEAVSSIEYLKTGRALAILRTFSKVYGLAGLRIGFGVMPAEIAELLNRVRQPFNTNSLAQAGALAALDDAVFFEKTLKWVHSGLDFLYRRLDIMGIEYFPSQANFFLVNVRQNADAVFEAMLKQGVIVRSMTEYGFPEFIRINVGLPAENERFLKALAKVLG
jgi:histidinol-phosphate aminotransferase